VGKWHQGKYSLINPEKYIGTEEPTFRSAWEKKAFIYCDTNKNVLKWSSELIVIPYFYTVDQKMHRYYTDLYMETLDKNTGKVNRYIVEIKPKDQTIMPKPPKRKTQKAMKNYKNKVLMVEKNHCKWKATKQFCDKKGYIFKIITEDHLFS
jgi:hypothetical protein